MSGQGSCHTGHVCADRMERERANATHFVMTYHIDLGVSQILRLAVFRARQNPRSCLFAFDMFLLICNRQLATQHSVHF